MKWPSLGYIGLWMLIGTAAFAGEEVAEVRPGVIREIRVEAKRTDPKVILNELTFSTGETLRQTDLDESRQNLLRLGLFRNLDLETEWEEAQDGYRVTVRADDGWFILPIPMFGSRGGDSFAALMLMERNYFRRSEGMMLWGSHSAGQSSGMLLITLPGFHALGGMAETRLNQYEYDDGAFNAKVFHDDAEGQRPEDFGTVTNQYRRLVRRTYGEAGGRVSPWLRLSGGLSFSSVAYDRIQIQDPGDSGDLNAWNLTLEIGREGRGDPALQGGAFGSFGRIFGLGMAGVKESLKPLSRMETARIIRLMMERGEPGLGSDEEYTKGLAGVDQAVLFRNRSMLSISLKGAAGDRLPPSQLWATGQRGLLKGLYAREYRGESLVAGSVSWNQPFLRNRIGLMTAEVFGDYALCRNDGNSHEQSGIGLTLTYRFWRFPLPLGGGATYSFEDDNWQYSIAVGGLF
ncbi:MAG: POTRA domain-containing protein [Kiritimatiellia bacterium]|nr:POTRA domain-containing protein [Kiritimatiellia bacterium]